MLTLNNKITGKPAVFHDIMKNKKNDNKTFREPKGKSVILNLWSIKFSKCHVGALLLYLTDMQKFMRYCSEETTLPRTLTVVFDEGGVIFSSTCMPQLHLPRTVESYEIFKLAIETVINDRADAFNSM